MWLVESKKYKTVSTKWANRIILDISPVSWVKVVPNDTKLFRIPTKCRYIPSEHRYLKKDEEVDIRLLGCELYNNTGTCRHILNVTSLKKKKRIEKYNRYKEDLKKICDDIGFRLPVCGWAIYFYVPMARTWSYKKKARMHGQMKLSKPDFSNYLKAFEDAICPTDERMAQISGGGKFFINSDRGFIEILLNQPVYNPFDVDLNTYEEDRLPLNLNNPLT